MSTSNNVEVSWIGSDRYEGKETRSDSIENRGQTPVFAKVGRVLGSWIQIAERNQTIVKREEGIVDMPNMRSPQECPEGEFTFTSRYLSPDSTADESDAVLYAPSLRVKSEPDEITAKDSPIRSRSPTPLEDISCIPVPPRSPTSTQQAPSSELSVAPQVKVEKKRKNKNSESPKEKRSARGRKAEPRRLQNMVAQKKYRDKRLHAAELMSESIIQFQVAFEGPERQSPEERLDRIKYFMNEYRKDMEVLDSALLAKQDEVVMKQNF